MRNPGHLAGVFSVRNQGNSPISQSKGCIVFDKEMLEDWLQENISLRDKLLLCLATDECKNKHIATICKIAHRAGWYEVQVPIGSLTPISEVFHTAMQSETKGYAIYIENGWKLNQKGKAHVGQLVAQFTNQNTSVAASALRDVLDQITNPDVKFFVEEAIRDVEHDAYRSAVVLSWCGAVSLLREHILQDTRLLCAFNAESLKRNVRWKDAAVYDDFGLMKEYDFLQVLCAVSSKVSRDLKLQLENALKFRNTCGHPNSLVIDSHMVNAHVSMLASNVFAKFG